MSLLQGNWKSDGSDDPSRGDKATSWSLADANDEAAAKVISVEAKPGSPMNFTYELTEPSKHFFMQVTASEKGRSSNISVGVVTPEKFRPGYGLKGMLYNGNLTNGGAAKKTSFGPHIKEGDVILCEYLETEEHVSVSWMINGENLGTGFQIETTETPFLPCLAVTGQAKVQVEILSQAPDMPTRELALSDPMNGQYTITSAYDESGEQIIPVDTNIGNNRPFGLSVSTQEDLVTIGVKVCNSLSIRKTIARKNSPSEYVLANAGRGGVISTKMMPPAPYDNVEQKIAACMNNAWKVMAISEDAKTLTFRNDENILATCSRLEQTLDTPALTSYL